MQPKEITMGADARLKIKAGIDKGADAVAPTLGAVGMTAIIDWEGLDPIVSDDGVTILKNLEFKDKYENMGLKMLRKSAVRTSNEAGDGTATTTVLARAIVNEAFKEIENDSSKIRSVYDRLQAGLVATLAELTKIKRDIGINDVEKIATISSLDPEIAKIIADVIKEVGVNGVVTVEKSSKIGYSSEVVKGMRFDRGLISPYFINDHEHEQTVLENPFVILVDRKISTNEHVTSIMKSIEATGNKSVLIIADDIDGLAFASLTQASKSVVMVAPNGKQVQGQFDIACVKNPYTSTRAKEFLHDVAVLTGATVISEEAGMRLDNCVAVDIGDKKGIAGYAEKVIVTRDHCTIIGGQQSPALLERVKAIENKIAESTSEYEIAMLEERLASLTGGIGVIRVGAYTDTDFNAKKYKFENAINSTQAGLQEGILPGGGYALFEVAGKLEDPIFRTALRAPFHQMVENAGMNKVNDVVVPNGNGISLNFKTKEQVDMFDEGIIDPYKVTRLALESAVSIASTLVTTETAIVLLDDGTKS